MVQLELELYKPNTDYIDKVIHEEPYVKILGTIKWSSEYKEHVALAQVESSLCFVSVVINAL